MDESDRQTETDPRFPTGRWHGHFLQREIGPRPVRMELSLTFRDGTINGAGRDCIGNFGFKGSYDIKKGEVNVVKRYVTNRVHYRGFAEVAKNGIWGVWSVADMKGGFHIWPKRQGEAADTLVEQEEIELPAGVLALREQ